MHPITATAFHDELEKIAGLWDRQADWARQDRAATKAAKTVEGGGQKAGKAVDAARRAFFRMGPVGQSAVLGGAISGVIGGAKGFSRNDPVYGQDGSARYPHLGDRAIRTGTGALGSGLTGAALSGGSVYLLRKALHG